MPREIRAAPHASSRYLSLLCQIRQVLVGIAGDRFPYHHRLLLVRVTGSRWVVASPDLNVYEEDLFGQDVVPLVPGQTFPLRCCPIFAFDDISIEELNELRGRGAELADILGVETLPTAGSVTVPDAVWVFADPAFPRFGAEVPTTCFATPAQYVARESKGVVRADGGEGDGIEWTAMERIMKQDLEDWLAEKREGAGRDKRLTVLRPTPRPLFRQAADTWDTTATSATQWGGIFVGPPAVQALTASVIQSGFEPMTHLSTYMRGSGLATQSGLANELMMHYWSLWSLACVDRLDLRRSCTAEHICRRILQAQKAIAVNPRSPDFVGLNTYVEHLEAITGAVHAPDFDEHVSKKDQAKASIMKQSRLAREEVAAADKRRKDKGGKNKGEKEGE